MRSRGSSWRLTEGTDAGVVEHKVEDEEQDDRPVVALPLLRHLHPPHTTGQMPRCSIPRALLRKTTGQRPPSTPTPVPTPMTGQMPGTCTGTRPKPRGTRSILQTRPETTGQVPGAAHTRPKPRVSNPSQLETVACSPGLHAHHPRDPSNLKGQHPRPATTYPCCSAAQLTRHAHTR